MRAVEEVELGALAEVVSGGTPSRSEAAFFGGDIPWVKIGDMLQGEVVCTDETITRAGLQASSAKVLPAGTLLLSIFATIGRTAILGVDAATNQAIAGLKIRDASQVRSDYLRRYLDHASKSLASQGRGVAQANINLSILRSHRVPLPPVEEQRRIAAVLDAADALRAKRGHALAKLDALSQALFVEMFGDLDAPDTGWRIVQLGELLERIDSGQSPVCLDRAAAPDEWGVLKAGAVTYCDFDESQTKALPVEAKPDPRHEVRAGDVLFSRKNTYELVAASAYVFRTRSKLLMSDLIFRLVIADRQRLNPIFLQQQLIHPKVRKRIQQLAGGSSGSMPNISKARLMSVEVCLPPIAAQQSFAEAVVAIQRGRAVMSVHSGQLDDLFASLQHRAFRGEL